MVTLFNSFLTYLVIAILFLAIIVCGVLTGKKLRENKNAKEAANTAADEK